MTASETAEGVSAHPITCPVCEESQTKSLFLAHDRNQGTPGEFPIAKCVSCGAWFQPQPLPDDELQRSYPNEYYEASCTEHGASIRMEAALRKLDVLQRFKSSPGRLLDVGCKSGEFVKMARDSGWDAIGIELSDDAAQIGRRAYDVEIMVNDFLKVALPAQSFDVVTMWHVLEHLPSPIPALEQATDLLERGGMLLIATPNPASIEASLFGRRWYHLDAPRHLVLIPPSSLIAALEELGMRVLHINFSIPAHNWTGIFSSIVSPQHIRPGMILPRRGDNPFRNALRHIAKSPFELLAQVEASLHRGGTYEICAVRTT